MLVAQPMHGSNLGALGLSTTPYHSQSVALMQQALRRLAVQTGNSRLDPIRVDGYVGGGTVAAMANAAKLIAGYVPGINTTVSKIENWLRDLPEPAKYIPNVLKILTEPIVAEFAFMALIESAPSVSQAIAVAVMEAAIAVNAAIGQFLQQYVSGGAGGGSGGGAGSGLLIIQPRAHQQRLATVSKYPPGSIARFHERRKTWTVYSPRRALSGPPIDIFPSVMGPAEAQITSSRMRPLPEARINYRARQAGLGRVELPVGPTSANAAQITSARMRPLPEAEITYRSQGGGLGVTPPPPEGYVEVARDLPAVPAGVTKAGTETDPFYKRGWFWGVVGVALAGGVTTVILVRRRRRR